MTYRSIFVILLYSHLNRSRLEHLVAEHLDHMHYLNDILSLGVESLNDVLITHTLGRLLLPLYVYSITNPSTDVSHVPPSVALL